MMIPPLASVEVTPSISQSGLFLKSQGDNGALARALQEATALAALILKGNDIACNKIGVFEAAVKIRLLATSRAVTTVCRGALLT
jgi:hypothetical protein